MNFREWKIGSVGAGAARLLQDHRQLKCVGVTSRGGFLQLDPAHMVFLSWEPYRGPLTINLADPSDPGPSLPSIHEALSPGAAGVIHRGQLSIPESGLRFDLRQAKIWEAPAPPAPVVDLPAAYRRYLAIARQVCRLKPGRPSRWLTSLLQLLDPQPPSPPDETVPGLAELASAIRTSAPPDGAHLLAALHPLLGLGQGLTPSGDDLAAGLLLALNRFPPAFRLGFTPPGLIEFGQNMVQMSYRRTTALSAGLMESAASGQADERLITVLDSLFAGPFQPEQSAAALCSWGSSSGSDAWAGVGLAFRSMME